MPVSISTDLSVRASLAAGVTGRESLLQDVSQPLAGIQFFLEPGHVVSLKTVYYMWGLVPTCMPYLGVFGLTTTEVADRNPGE
jgi:hypothetical protein